MSQLRQYEKQLVAADVRIKVVTFDGDWLAAAYAKKTQLPWPLLLDPDQSLYKAYAMKHGNWWNIYNPLSVAKYLWLIVRGHAPGRPGTDWRQLGGDVLIDPDGNVSLHYVSSDPHDRPTPQSILEIVARSTP
ncbi:MAG: redoxin domain-containing protein [Pirellulaceae bacterium]|nr:redoxin domain-containing protein [Pirellulaceae bacterium]